MANRTRRASIEVITDHSNSPGNGSESNNVKMEGEYDIEKLILKGQRFGFDKSSIRNPVLRALLDGVFDVDCPLSTLQGVPHILQTIWKDIIEWWITFIPMGEMLNTSLSWGRKKGEGTREVAFHKFNTELSFPAPKDIYINMMPFVMEETFEKTSLPTYLKPYWDNIFDNIYKVGSVTRQLIPESEYGKIGYLTVHECYIRENETQRRPGLHTDCPGKLMIAPNDDGDCFCIGRVSEDDKDKVFDILDDVQIGDGLVKDKAITFTHSWGFGITQYGSDLDGGIYMASNVSDSCEVWDCRITQGENGEEVIGNLGDVEHLRDYIFRSETMEANRMYWITDRTPHESLPLKEGSYRQYFRLVTSNVSVWFEEHSTKNPNGVVPDPAITEVVKGSKFKNWSALVD